MFKYKCLFWIIWYFICAHRKIKSLFIFGHKSAFIFLLTLINVYDQCTGTITQYVIKELPYGWVQEWLNRFFSMQLTMTKRLKEDINDLWKQYDRQGCCWLKSEDVTDLLVIFNSGCNLFHGHCHALFQNVLQFSKSSYLGLDILATIYNGLS